MISHKKKFIFVHIPKVAGTSVVGSSTIKTKLSEYAFKQPKKDYSINNLPFQPDDKNKFDPQPNHMRASDFVKYGYVTEIEFETYFKFAFVRNPWDRIVSEYKYRGYMNHYSFKEFLFKHMPNPSWSDQYCHIIPQYDFLYNGEGKLLVDFIGKFESLQEDYDKICQMLDIPKHTMSHANKSSGLLQRDTSWRMITKNSLRYIRASLNGQRKANTFSKYTEYYDSESREFIAKLYKNDIETFDYKFGK